jgi:hypothetical protein
MGGWEDNTKMYHRKIKCDAVDEINWLEKRMQWGALANKTMNLRVLQNFDWLSDINF